MTPQQIERRRLECEARHVLSMPYAQRKPWLNGIGEKRGRAAQRYLEEEVIRQFRLQKGAA